MTDIQMSLSHSLSLFLSHSLLCGIHTRIQTHTQLHVCVSAELSLILRITELNKIIERERDADRHRERERESDLISWLDGVRYWYWAYCPVETGSRPGPDTQILHLIILNSSSTNNEQHIPPESAWLLSPSSAQVEAGKWLHWLGSHRVLSICS